MWPLTRQLLSYSSLYLLYVSLDCLRETISQMNNWQGIDSCQYSGDFSDRCLGSWIFIGPNVLALCSSSWADTLKMEIDEHSPQWEEHMLSFTYFQYITYSTHSRHQYILFIYMWHNILILFHMGLCVHLKIILHHTTCSFMNSMTICWASFVGGHWGPSTRRCTWPQFSRALSCSSWSLTIRVLKIGWHGKRMLTLLSLGKTL